MIYSRVLICFLSEPSNLVPPGCTNKPERNLLKTNSYICFRKRSVGVIETEKVKLSTSPKNLPKLCEASI